jgi:hypothetical protein
VGAKQPSVSHVGGRRSFGSVKVRAIRKVIHAYVKRSDTLMWAATLTGACRYHDAADSG